VGAKTEKKLAKYIVVLSVYSCFVVYYQVLNISFMLAVAIRQHVTCLESDVGGRHQPAAVLCM